MLHRLLDRYRTKIKSTGNVNPDCPALSCYEYADNSEGKSGTCVLRAEHLLYMLDQMESFDDETKFNRWLGFIQGVLWADGAVTLNQLRDETRPYVDRLKSSHEFGRRRLDLLQQWQKDLPEPYRTEICNILANGQIKP